MKCGMALEIDSKKDSRRTVGKILEKLTFSLVVHVEKANKLFQTRLQDKTGVDLLIVLRHNIKTRHASINNMLEMDTNRNCTTG